MASTTETLKVTDHSEIGPLLSDADEGPVLLEKDGVVYRLNRVGRTDAKQDLWAAYDQERLLRTLDEVAGSWADLDTDRMIRDVYEARERGSRPIDKP
jgi:hypothetical protein